MKLDKIFKALSDETRLRIINILQQCAGCCVCDLEKILQESQPKISRHLAYLKRENIVKDERRGNMIIYSLNLSSEINVSLMEFLQTILPLYPKFATDTEQFNILLNNSQLSSLGR